MSMQLEDLDPITKYDELKLSIDTILESFEILSGIEKFYAQNLHRLQLNKQSNACEQNSTHCGYLQSNSDDLFEYIEMTKLINVVGNIISLRAVRGNSTGTKQSFVAVRNFKSNDNIFFNRYHEEN